MPAAPHRPTGFRRPPRALRPQPRFGSRSPAGVRTPLAPDRLFGPARLLRLSTVWEHIDHEQTWAHIAAESGYADQSHLIREFRHFTGTTPAALIT
jgi:hypothetical protein